ncbi:MAG: glycosyl hydrolase family 18 protein [Actinomycetota bacterium]
MRHSCAAFGRETGGALSARLGRAILPLFLVILSSGGVLPHASTPRDLPGASPMAVMEESLSHRPLWLTPATIVPVPAPAELARAGRLRPHELFAFAPYWTLDRAAAFNMRGLTTVAYFGVDVAGNGRLIREGTGWEGYESQQLAELISRAHKAGIRVVLTAKTFHADSLHQLATDRTAAARLGRELGAAIKAKNLDGANLDFEGFGTQDRARFPRFIDGVTKALHQQDEAWQVTVDTYVSSAQVEDTFYDVRAISRVVDALFVMGYDMYASGVASPNAPLPRYQTAIEAYIAKVPAAKIILGTPFYGYDWPTVSNAPHARATGPKTPITYADIVGAGWPRYWDVDAQSPWTAYKVGSQWHEVYYDDPSSLSQKAHLAAAYRVRGMGAWALGMEGADARLIQALLGKAVSILNGPAGPARSVAAPKPTTSSSPKSSPKAKPKPKPSPSASPSPSETPLPVPLPTI